MVPGEDLVIFSASVCIECGIDAALLERPEPRVEIEEFVPAVELTAEFVRAQKNLAQSAVASRKDCLEEACICVVPAERYLLACDAVLEKLLLFVDSADCVLRLPLERGKGLGNEGRSACRNLYTLSFGTFGQIVEEVDDLLTKTRYADDVLARFGRKTYHEIELDTCPAACKSGCTGGHELVFGYVLVDGIAQTLSSRFGSKGKTAAANLFELFGELSRETVNSQRRQVYADLVLLRPLEHIVKKVAQLCVVAGGKGGEGDLVVACIGAEGAAHIVYGAGLTLADGSVDETRLTETAAADTASENLGNSAVVHYLDERNNKVVYCYYTS